MNATVSARHCDISDELRQRAAAIIDRLASLLHRPVDGTVVFDVAPQLATAEIRLHGGGGESYIATGEDKDHRSALDRAEERIRRQLEKNESSRRGRGAKDTV